MPAISATAPGKIILFGEHAVVYGRPAIAIPLLSVRARAIVSANPKGKPGIIHVQAPDIGLESKLDGLPVENPLASVIRLTLAELGIERAPACTIRIVSTIPVAAGLGSGAAVSVAILRAFSGFLGHPFSDERVCALAFEVEKLYHGTPSGIDNTVITYAKPVFFIREQPVETFHASGSFTLVIGDTGIPSLTAVAVGDLRLARQANPGHYESLFDQIGQIVWEARQSIETGASQLLGPLMNRNHALLAEMGVSLPELDRLVEAAREAGATGAKLSGGGRGGNMIALVDPGRVQKVVRSLREAGATRTLVTQI